MTNKAVLEIKGLKKYYGSKLILNNLDIIVNKGDIYGFLGPNGSGKTTTIRSILGLVNFQEGRIALNGYDIKADFKKAISRVGAVVETPRFYETYSGRWNLLRMAEFYGDIPKARIDEVLEITGMSKAAKEKVRTYSLGMKQRLGIARALLNSPEFVILDEPTNGLDPQGMKEMRETILQLNNERNITFFVSSHLLSEVEVLCNRVGILHKGMKVEEGFVSSLLNRENEVLEIYTSDINTAVKELGQLQFIKSVNIQPNGVIVEALKGFSEDMIKLLVEKNIKIRYVIPKNQSLEEHFIELTKGGDQIA